MEEVCVLRDTLLKIYMLLIRIDGVTMFVI